MERLPNEVLMMILERLPSRELLETARVCRRWTELAARRALAVRHPCDLCRMHHGLVTMEVTSRLDSLRIFLNLTVDTCPYLRDLTVHAANAFSSDNLEALDRLPCLEHLDVFILSRVLDTRLLPVLLRLTSLVINETVCPNVLHMLSKSQHLRSLYMYGRALYYPPRELLTVIRARRHHLRELALRCTELKDPAYAVIGQCEFLTSLQLYSCWLMTIKGAMCVIQPQLLRCLHITGARMVRSKALLIVIEQLPLLIEELVLSVTWFTDVHIPSLVTRLPTLRVLELWRCSLTSQSILMLANGLSGLLTLDTDIGLSEKNIHSLGKHIALTNLRCSLESQDSYMIMKTNREFLKVRSVHARYEKKYIRTGEGYRGALYYFWTRNRDLKPLPSTAHPVFDDDDEEF